MAVTYLPSQHVDDEKAQQNFEYIESHAVFDSTVEYFSGPGLTTVTDATFGGTVKQDGSLCVHYDTTASRAYLSARANGVWHVMAGPVV